MASGWSFVKRFLRTVALGASVFCLLAPAAAGQTTEHFEYGAYAHVLEKYVTSQGQVRYAALKTDRTDLEAFIAQLAAISPDNRPGLFPETAAQRAYWINAYNAFVLRSVVKSYPVKGPLDIRYGFGLLFFKRARHVAGGKRLSLDHIEHQILRKRFPDPRIHFAINCASTSCPPLVPKPFLPETLEAQLEEVARAFIQDERNVRLRGDVLLLSKIFDWYQDDFVSFLRQSGRTQTTVVDYVLLYLPAEIAERIRAEHPRVKFLNYDWSLNDAPTPPN
ncbi:MAG: DUF547 domain-containing protein [Terriglobia bacterium]